jgi:FkbM family methyltransferase
VGGGPPSLHFHFERISGDVNLISKIWMTVGAIRRDPFNESEPNRAVMRFFGAELGLRLLRQDVCSAFINDTRLLVPAGMKGGVHFVEPGLCEFEDMSFVAHFLRPGDLFIDVGANLGAYTLLASGGTGARSISFEPHPITFKYLNATIQMNGLSHLARPLQQGLGRARDQVTFTQSLGTENHIAPSGASGSLTVEIVPLDSVLEAENPTAIKIDVEGYESEAIAGALKTMARDSLKALIIERNDSARRYGFSEEELHQRIRGLGFAPKAYSPRARVLRDLSENYRGNIIYVRDPDFVLERLQKAPQFTFRGKRI